MSGLFFAEAALVAEWAQWLSDNDLPQECAEEIALFPLTNDQADYVRAFSARWELMLDRRARA